MPPENFTNPALQKGACNGTSDLATHGDTEPGPTHTTLREEDEVLRSSSFSGTTQ